MSAKTLLSTKTRGLVTSYLVGKGHLFTAAAGGNGLTAEGRNLGGQLGHHRAAQVFAVNAPNAHQKSYLNKSQNRLTSTTPPAASSTTVAAASAAGVGSTTGVGHIGPVAAIPKREASTQARRQQQLLEAVEHQPLAYQPQPQQLQIERQPAYYEQSDTFRASDLVTLQCSQAELKPKPSVEQLLFGHFFTDHMFQVEWDHERGWSTPLITKLHNLEIHPGSKVLHYAVQAFEGAKAFRGHDDRIRFFRLDANVKRLLRSSRRLALPDFDELELMHCIHKLVQLDQEWIPKIDSGQPMTSLYIRPTIMGIEPSLGVASSKKSLLYVLLSPVGPYFKTGFKPVTLYADPDFVRAWPGGAGHAKLGSNYAPTIMIQRQAEKLGIQQVLWLYDNDMKLTEVGTMNIFLAIRHPRTGKIHLITPPLKDGVILPGITRDSILQLARSWDDVVCEERYVTIGELQQLVHEQRLIEMFGTGTACIVCPINEICMKDGTRIRIPFTDVTKADKPMLGQSNDTFLTRRLLKAITDIQYGRTPHPWAQELAD